jgi:hypothetical protein
MGDVRISALWRSVAVALALILTLAGVGRGLVAASDAAPITIAGIVVSICHPSSGDAPASDPRGHNCCEDCALCAAVVPPTPPMLSKPVQVALIGRLGEPVSSVRLLGRPWTPRQSQGPPVG